MTKLAGPSTAVRVLTAVAAIVALLLVAWTGAAVTPNLHDWVGFVVLRCARVAAFGAVFVAVRTARRLRDRGRRVTESSSAQTRTVLNGWRVWLLRSGVVSLMVLGGYGLLRWGIPLDWVALVAVAGWVGFGA
jgi:hypothetical protein